MLPINKQVIITEGYCWYIGEIKFMSLNIRAVKLIENLVNDIRNGKKLTILG